MSLRLSPWLAAIGAVGLAEGRAGAIDVSGSAGGGYARSDSWADALHVDSTTWDWEAALALAGSPLRPGLLQWMADGSYRAVRSAYIRSSNRTDGFGFRLQCALLNDSPLPISLFGSRSWADFSSDAEAARAGGTVTDTFGGTALLRSGRYPTLRLAATRTDLSTTNLGGDNSKSDTTGLTVGLAHNLANHSYSIDYSTGWNHGSFAETNFRSHALNTLVTAAPSPAVLVRLYDRYYLRDPTNDDPTNPRYDDNSLGAGVQWRPGRRLTSSLDYGYRHLLVEASGAPTSEQLAHAVTEATYFRLRPSLALLGGVAFNYAVERRGADERRAAGESASAGLVWRRLVGRTALTAGGGGSLGAVEPEVGDATATYGVNASGGLTHTRQRARFMASYTGSYLSDAAGQAGQSLQQRVQLDGEGLLRHDVGWRAILIVAGARHEDHVLGTSLSRSASLTGSAQWRRYTFNLGIGESDGLSSALANPGVSDGLFLPASYDTHTRFATLSSTQVLDGGHFFLTELARALTTEAPARPSQFEDAAGLVASYVIGAVTLSLDERYSYGGTGDARQSVNLVMVRLLRSFGASF